MTALAASLILLALPAGALASISWSGASGVDRNGGTVISVSCPASDQCTAVDFAGQEITYNPTNNNVIETASINGTTALQAVSCSSTSQCTAVDGEGHEVTFDPTSGQSSDGPEVVDAGNTFYGLDCTSDTQCVATNHNGDAVVFNPRNVSGASTGCPDGSVGATCFAIDTGHNTERLSCWNNGTEECTAVDASGYEVTFDPTNPGTPTPVAVDAGVTLYAVSCQPDGSLCTAIGTDGKAVDFSPTSPATATTVQVTAIPNPDPLYSVSCTSATACEVVDNRGNAYTVNPTMNTASAGVPVDEGEVHQISCVSGAECSAVDNVGNEVTFDPTDPSGTDTGPIFIDPANGLHSMACASSSLCVGGDSVGQIVTFDPSDPSGANPPVGIDAVDVTLNGISCPSAHQCTAIDGVGSAYTFDPGNLSSTQTQVISSGDTIFGIACPSTGECVVVDQNGDEYTFAPGGGTTGPVALNTIYPNYLTSVACPSAEQCTAVGAAGEVATFDPETSKIDATAGLDNGNSLTAVACPSSGQCTAVDNDGNEVTFDPANPAGGAVSNIDGSNAIEGIACLSTEECVAVDANGNAIEDDAGSWTVEPLSGEEVLESIACSPANQCVAASPTGFVSVGTFTSPPPPPLPVSLGAPTITGGIQVGDTLSEAHGSWSNGPTTSYSYQWQRCNSAGTGCVAIAGATGQTYTLVAADVGSTIRVVETASNANGAGAGSSSNPTAVVTAVPVPVAVTTSLPAAPFAKLLKVLISSKNHTAKFKFKAIGDATHYKCAIVRKPTRKGAKTPAPKYAACGGTTKKYSKLKAGKYLFYVKVVGPGGSGVDVYHFKIK